MACLVLIGFGLALFLVTRSRSPVRGPLAEHLALEDEKGQPFTERTIRSKPTVLFLGYTNCPDVCPNTLARMARWARKLGRQSNSLTFAFLSVDPQRDTVVVRRTYVAAFSPTMKGISGTQDEVLRVSKLLDAPYRIALDGEGGYSVAHSADVLAIGTDGRVAARITPATSDERATQILRQLISS